MLFEGHFYFHSKHSLLNLYIKVPIEITIPKVHPSKIPPNPNPIRKEPKV